MNPGDRVRVTKSIPSHFPTEGIFKEWKRDNPHGTQYCIVEFMSTNPKLGKFIMAFDPWDLELVMADTGTCDTPTTTGRRFKQDHTCTLPFGHPPGHLCNVCGHMWSDPEPTLKLIPKYAALYPDPVLDKEVPNEGS